MNHTLIICNLLMTFKPQNMKINTKLDIQQHLQPQVVHCSSNNRDRKETRRLLSCGMQHHVIWQKLINISEQLTAAIITVMNAVYVKQSSLPTKVHQVRFGFLMEMSIRWLSPRMPHYAVWVHTDYHFRGPCCLPSSG